MFSTICRKCELLIKYSGVGKTAHTRRALTCQHLVPPWSLAWAAGPQRSGTWDQCWRTPPVGQSRKDDGSRRTRHLQGHITVTVSSCLWMFSSNLWELREKRTASAWASLTRSGFVAKYSVEETGHTDAAANVRAYADHCTCCSQYTALAAWEEGDKQRHRGVGGGLMSAHDFYSKPTDISLKLLVFFSGCTQLFHPTP